LLFEITELLKPLIKEEDYRFDSLPGVREVQVCSVSGEIPSPYCSQTRPAMFIPGVSPIQTCQIHRSIIIDEKSGYRVTKEGEGTRTAVREVWPTDMLKLFEEAGIPRPVPPPFLESLDLQAGGGKTKAPRIISPLEGASYILRPGSSSYHRIPLIGAADGEVREMFWFANGVFLGKAEPKKTLYWEPDPGRYYLILLDDRGFSADRMVTVTMVP
jgi:penicillin-binding protein 1C